MIMVDCLLSLPGLKTKFVGQRIYSFRTVGSTNDIALQLADDGAPEGTIILADTQTRGRGRRSRTWISPVGGIWASIILRPSFQLSHIVPLTLTTALAVTLGIQNITSLPIKIKWPNDLFIRGKKVGGILAEMPSLLASHSSPVIVVGIGINLNIPLSLLPEGATSLAEESGQKIDRDELLVNLANELEAAYLILTKSGFGPLRERVRAYLLNLGQQVQVENIGKGWAEDIDVLGRLILRKADGSKVKVVSGDMVSVQLSGIRS